MKIENAYKKNKLRVEIRKQLKEAVSHRIKQIDEAGTKAADEAKIGKLSEELNKVNKIKTILEKCNLPHYIGENLYSKVVQEIDKSILEYEEAKNTLNEKLNGVEEKKKKSPKSKDK